MCATATASAGWAATSSACSCPTPTRTQALKKADALAQALEASPTSWNGHVIPVSFAYGAFELKSGDNPDTAMARADEAMYAHKKAQRSAAE